jgi:hypothetical protein
VGRFTSSTVSAADRPPLSTTCPTPTPTPETATSATTATRTFDVDFLDPVYAHGTGTPEIGGPTPWEAPRLVRGLQGLDPVGGDVVDQSTRTIGFAVRLLHHLLTERWLVRWQRWRAPG